MPLLRRLALLILLAVHFRTTHSIGICCGSDCAPGTCDTTREFQKGQQDLGIYYPEPVNSTGCTPNTVLPCCGFNCVDGGCRTQRPTSKRVVTTTSPKPGEVRLINAVVGCCKNCDLCDQTVVATTRGKTVQQRDIVQPTVMPVFRPHGHGLNLESYSPQITPQAVFRREDQQGIGWCPGGCAPPCINCDDLQASCVISPRAHPEKALPYCKTEPPMVSTPTKPGSPALPTVPLTDDIVEALAGKSQRQIVFRIRNKLPEPIAVVGDVDLKLSQNYISRRLLISLGLGGQATPYPKNLQPSPAILSPQTLNVTLISETILLDISFLVAARDPKTGQPYEDPTKSAVNTYTNVRFNIFGDGKTPTSDFTVSDVILGNILLREIDALGVVGVYQRPVQDGTRFAIRLVAGELWGDDADSQKGKAKPKAPPVCPSAVTI